MFCSFITLLLKPMHLGCNTLKKTNPQESKRCSFISSVTATLCKLVDIIDDHVNAKPHLLIMTERVLQKNKTFFFFDVFAARLNCEGRMNWRRCVNPPDLYMKVVSAM